MYELFQLNVAISNDKEEYCSVSVHAPGGFAYTETFIQNDAQDSPLKRETRNRLFISILKNTKGEH